MDRERRAYGQETRNFLTRLLPHDSFGTFLKVFKQYVYIYDYLPPQEEQGVFEPEMSKLYCKDAFKSLGLYT
jgi:hypothetical protein